MDKKPHATPKKAAPANKKTASDGKKTQTAKKAAGGNKSLKDDFYVNEIDIIEIDYI